MSEEDIGKMAERTSVSDSTRDENKNEVFLRVNNLKASRFILYFTGPQLFSARLTVERTRKYSVDS